ncbi:HD-GYP domain-containing protein [Psychrobacillus vulpis]|uniref:HD-GYP domain-containing protein n=1 Tax=Psychrobacillus vulpis TaxID=2325572 RepID=A0A544TVS5_9BACI|nr:HD-GYP domain-containing protein [Psychrobacillus vulpis]TQR21547.1 HD-GYP domain-containing protein [Psychrobacillus vulpis]
MILTIEQMKDIKMKKHLSRVITDQSVTTYIGHANNISYSLYTLLPESTSWIYYNPNDCSDFTERYTILSGELEVERNGENIVLYPGDVIDTTKNDAIFTCYTKEGVEILLEMTSSYFEMSFTEREIIQLDAKRIQEVDGYTYHHCARIRDYSIELWKRLKPKSEGLSILSLGSYFHDIGKLAVPIEILNKLGNLTDDEWKIIKMHTTIGAEMMRNHEIERLRQAAFIVEEHHERYDGKGYPFGLKGDEISLEASIVSVVDAFDAMTTNRVYRGAITIEEAIQEMKNGRGTQFNPIVIDEFIKMLEEKNNEWQKDVMRVNTSHLIKRSGENVLSNRA